MKRENRINLWFLGIFLAMTLPGVVILVRKRMHGGAPPLMFPDSMSHRLAYMVPLPAPPDATWFVPPLTWAWVDTLAKERSGVARAISDTDLHGDPVPMISSDHRVQLVSVVENSSGRRKVSMLLWSGDEAGEILLVEVPASGAHPASAMTPVRPVVASLTVPQPVRQELMACGFLRPPTHVTWIDAETSARSTFDLQIRAKNGEISTSRVNFFTN